MVGHGIRIKVVALVLGAAVVLGGVGVALWSNNSAAQAAGAYQQRRQSLEAKLHAATQQGYTSRDLEPVIVHLQTLDRSQDPWWIPPSRPSYFQQRAAETVRIQSQLEVLEQGLLDQARSDAGQRVNADKAEIAQAQQNNAADPDVQALQQRLDAAVQGAAAARTLHDYRAVAQQAQAILPDATSLNVQAQQENQQIQQAAQQLVAQNSSNLGAIQQAGNQALANGRNEATIVAYMNRGSPFKGYDAIQREYSRLEKFAGMIGSRDVNQAAQGTTGVQRYAGTIHSALLAGLPSQVVLVSFQSQYLWAYQGGQVVMENAVTTGVWGATDFGTDFGPMKVLWKSHPWTMHSPWPKGSQYWYPDTVVQWTTFFTKSGESIHDASWEPDSQLGPGSQFNPSTRSHGCVHLPFDKAQWMFNWAPVGMPVIVYPGDGSPVANQLSKITTDDHGNPQSAR